MHRPPKWVQGFIDRHGKPRFYFRRPGFKRVPLPGLPWSPEFMAAYEAAVSDAPIKLEIGARRTKPGTINALVVGLYGSTEFQGWSPETQRAGGTSLSVSVLNTATRQWPICGLVM